MDPSSPMPTPGGQACAHPRAWLLTILRHTHLNRVRKKSAVLLFDGDAAEATFDRLGTAAPSAEEIVISETFEAGVAAALASLPETIGAMLNGTADGIAVPVAGPLPGRAGPLCEQDVSEGLQQHVTILTTDLVSRTI